MTTEEQVRRKARVLAAFMSQQEAMGFAMSFAVNGQAFMNEWTKRNAARSLVARGYTAPRVEQLPSKAKAHVAKVTAHPAYASFYQNVEFKMVELGKLLAFQHWMDTDVSDGVHGAGITGQPTDDELFEKCLPSNIVPAAHTLWLPTGAANQFSVMVYSHNNTLSFKPGLDQVNGLIQVLVHANANLMMVREFGGRYVLANGYHRAWWLRSCGVEMVPVAVSHVGAAHELAQPGSIQADVMLSDQPAIVDHFLDDNFSVTTDARSTLRAIKVTAEVLTVPRLV